ncbi:MAG: hypothetical protein ACO1RX_14070 [Candidatus Sericytochromatia bacterium]
MAQFSVSVKSDVLQQRVNAAQTRDIDKVSQQFQLDKTQLLGDGLDINEAGHLPFDTFMQLSGNDTKITKADVLKFAGTETAYGIVREYAQHIADSLPTKVMESIPVNGTDVVSELNFSVTHRGEEIIVKAKRNPLSAPEGAKTEATAAAVFSVIGGRDLNADGSIAIGGELQGNKAFVQTAGDAVKLAGSDMVVSPTEALTAIFEKAGKFALQDVEIKYAP